MSALRQVCDLRPPSGEIVSQSVRERMYRKLSRQTEADRAALRRLDVEARAMERQERERAYKASRSADQIRETTLRFYRMRDWLRARGAK